LPDEGIADVDVKIKVTELLTGDDINGAIGLLCADQGYGSTYQAAGQHFF